MQYWDVVTRSFRIAWRHKYLWLIALFASEGGGGFNSGFSPPTSGGSSGSSTASHEQPVGTPDLSAVQQQVTTWLGDHVGLIVVVLIAFLLVAVLFFVLAAVCEGATVRASAEHDAERPFDLGMAWRSGVATMWVIVRFRLLIIALGVPLTLLFIGFAIGVIVAIVNHNVGAALGLIPIGLLLGLLAIPYTIYLYFLDRLGSRAAVLEQLGARAAIVRGHRLLRKRLGRTLLVWLLGIAVGIAAGIALACMLGIVSLPFFIIGAAAFAGHSPAAWPVVVLSVLILLPLSLIIGGFFSAQGSTYWTLAFRRLDLDLPPAGYDQYQQPPAPPPVTP